MSEYFNLLGFRLFKIGTKRLIEFGGNNYHDIMDIVKGWTNCFAIRPNTPWLNVILKSYDNTM